MNRSALFLPLALALATSLGCPKEPEGQLPSGAAPSKPDAKPEAPTEPAPEKPAAADGEKIAWLHDDYAAALAQAKLADKPLIVDLWAPWCHTCISMKTYVLTDARITAKKDAFVWLAVDTDKPENADATEAMPQSFWPTFYALSPTGGVLARHVGSATVDEFVAFLDRAAAKKKQGGTTLVDRLRAGDAARAAGDLPGAAKAYEAALAAAEDDPRRFAAAVSLIEALYKADNFERCAEVGAARLDDMKNASSASAADFTYFAVTCSERAKREDHAALVARAAGPDGPLRTLLANPEAKLSVDDRADALRILRELEDQRGNKDEAKKLAVQQRKLLDDEVAKLDDPYTAMTYHWPRAEVYAYLGVPGELVADLEASAKALPKEYEPVYRLAWVLLQAGRADEAVAPAEAAVARTYGPRKARALAVLADVHKARGDVEAEREARAAIVAHLRSLPEHQRPAKKIAAAEQALAAVGKPAP